MNDEYPTRYVGRTYTHAGRLFTIIAIMAPKCPFCPEALQVLYLDDNTRGVIDNSSLIKETGIYTVSPLDN